MPSTSFKMRDVEPAMSLTNSALTATPSTPGCDARNGKLSTDDPAREVTPELAEISRLRAELARSRQECALLKKFAAYLSTTGLK